jgi:hypothetical protein
MRKLFAKIKIFDRLSDVEQKNEFSLPEHLSALAVTVRNTPDLNNRK